jgi:hypothetical protein
MQSAPLFSQPGSFWLGSFLVAEALMTLPTWFLTDAQREYIVGFALFSAPGLALTISTTVALGLCVGWIGHKLGLGV